MLLGLCAAAVIFFIEAALVNGPLRPPLRALEHNLARGGLSTHVFALLLSSIVAYVAAAIAIALFIARPHGLSWRGLGYRPVPLLRLAIVLPVYPATLITANAMMVLVIKYVFHGNFSNPQAQEIAGGVTRTVPNTIGLLLLVAVLAPLVEETVFRGVLYQWLRKGLPVWGATIISAAIFAAAHAIPLIFPWLFITGIALALVFEYCQSLFASMLLHGLINGVNVLILLATLPKH